MKFGDRMFQPVDIGDDEYVYNVDIKVKNSMDKSRYTKKWGTYFQIRSSELVGDTKAKYMVCISACLGLYMGKLVDSNRNEEEEYWCGELMAERCNQYMDMHYINNTIYHAYWKSYECDEERHCNAEKEKVKLCNQKKANVIFMNHYLVKATRRIVAGDKIENVL